MNFAGYSFVIK